MSKYRPDLGKILTLISFVSVLTGCYLYLEEAHRQMTSILTEMKGIAQVERDRDERWMSDDDASFATIGRGVRDLAVDHDGLYAVIAGSTDDINYRVGALAGRLLERHPCQGD